LSKTCRDEGQEASPLAWEPSVRASEMTKP
jgi:hypothetical protein